MNKLFILLFLLISMACFGQNKITASRASETGEPGIIRLDTISIPANQIQLERLNTIQEKINANQKEFADLLELIFGVKIEEVEWWGFKQGKFQFILKPKKK